MGIYDEYIITLKHSIYHEWEYINDSPWYSHYWCLRFLNSFGTTWTSVGSTSRQPGLQLLQRSSNILLSSSFRWPEIGYSNPPKDRTVKSYKILLKYSDNLLSYLFGYFIPQHKYSKGGLLEVKILLDPFGVRQGFWFYFKTSESAPESPRSPFSQRTGPRTWGSSLMALLSCWQLVRYTKSHDIHTLSGSCNLVSGLVHPRYRWTHPTYTTGLTGVMTYLLAAIFGMKNHWFTAHPCRLARP